MCPRSSDPFYVVTYYIKWVTSSLTHSSINMGIFRRKTFRSKNIKNEENV